MPSSAKSNAIEQICKIAAGEMMRWSGPTGKTVTRYPTSQEQLSALRLIVDKTVPSLQAVELSGAEGEPLYPQEPAHNPRQLSRAILAVLGQAKLSDEGETEDRMPAGKFNFTAQPFPDEVDALDLSSPDIAPAIDERVLVGEHGCWIERTPDGRWRSLHGDGSLHRYHATRAEAEQQAGSLRW